MKASRICFEFAKLFCLVYDYYVKRLLPIFYNILFFLFFFAFAPHAYANWTLKPYPSPLFANTPYADFAFSSTTDRLESGLKQYRFQAFRAGDGRSPIEFGIVDFMVGDGNPKVRIENDRHKVTIKGIIIEKAKSASYLGHVQGSWKIELCPLHLIAGGVVGLKGCDGYLFKGNVEVGPPGSADVGIPAIELNKATVKYGVPVNVTLRNAVEDSPYTIWWDRTAVYQNAVFHKTADQKFAPPQASTSTEGGQLVATISIKPPSTLGAWNLCMTPHNTPFGKLTIIGLSCDFKIPGILVTTSQDQVDNDDRGPVKSNAAGFPSDTPEPTLACTRRLNPTAGVILPTEDPNFDPTTFTECAPVELPCAQYINPTTGATLAPEIAAKTVYKQCTAVNTALGPIDIDASSFVKSLFGVLLGISGGIAMILIIAAGYTMITSQGDPTKVQGARETITSAVVGLLFIILSLVILEVIGVDLLHIPGLGR